MEVFVISYRSIIKGVELNTIEGVFSTVYKAGEAIDSIIGSIIQQWENEFVLDVCKYTGGEDNDCPCVHIEEKDSYGFPELEINIETYKETVDELLIQ